MPTEGESRPMVGTMDTSGQLIRGIPTMEQFEAFQEYMSRIHEYVFDPIHQYYNTMKVDINAFQYPALDLMKCPPLQILDETFSAVHAFSYSIGWFSPKTTTFVINLCDQIDTEDPEHHLMFSEIFDMFLNDEAVYYHAQHFEICINHPIEDYRTLLPLYSLFEFDIKTLTVKCEGTRGVGPLLEADMHQLTRVWVVLNLMLDTIRDREIGGQMMAVAGWKTSVDDVCAHFNLNGLVQHLQEKMLDMGDVVDCRAAMAERSQRLQEITHTWPISQVPLRSLAQSTCDFSLEDVELQ